MTMLLLVFLFCVFIKKSHELRFQGILLLCLNKYNFNSVAVYYENIEFLYLRKLDSKGFLFLIPHFFIFLSSQFSVNINIVKELREFHSANEILVVFIYVQQRAHEF